MTCTIPHCTEPATCGASWHRVCEKHWQDVEDLMRMELEKDGTDQFATAYAKAVRVVSKNAVTQEPTK